MKTAILLASVFVLTTATGFTETRLDLRVSPHISAAPGTVRVRTTVVPHADNRELIVEAEGENFYRRSDVGLEGEREPTVREFTYSNLPEGSYKIAVRLLDIGGERASAIQQVEVVGLAR